MMRIKSSVALRRIFSAAFVYGLVLSGIAFSNLVFPSLATAQAPRFLYTFAQADSLSAPGGRLVADSAGNLYGAAQQPNFGVIYQLSPPTTKGHWTATNLYTFQCQADGCYPNGGMVLDAKGNLYGTTAGSSINGCSAAACGSVFELSPPASAGGAWTFATLFSFNGSDGAAPKPGLIMDKAGNLYGTTGNAGSLGGGTAFELSPPPTAGGAWSETTLYDFPAASGVVAGLNFDRAGNLYGMTEYGGETSCSLEDSPVGCGIIYQLVRPTSKGAGWTENTLYQFSGGSDGAFPASSLVADDEGNLYGTASGGGNPSCLSRGFAYGCGVAFELSPPATKNSPWTESVLYSFGGSGSAINPWTNLVRDGAGNLYGSSADTVSYGDVFKLSPPASGSSTWTETTLASFTNTNAYAPGDLVFVNRVGLVGVQVYGGPGHGDVFAVRP
jgi:hypothetical protein